MSNDMQPRLQRRAEQLPRVAGVAAATIAVEANADTFAYTDIYVCDCTHTQKLSLIHKLHSNNSQQASRGGVGQSMCLFTAIF